VYVEVDVVVGSCVVVVLVVVVVFGVVVVVVVGSGVVVVVVVGSVVAVVLIVVAVDSVVVLVVVLVVVVVVVVVVDIVVVVVVVVDVVVVVVAVVVVGSGVVGIGFGGFLPSKQASTAAIGMPWAMTCVKHSFSPEVKQKHSFLVFHVKYVYPWPCFTSSSVQSCWHSSLVSTSLGILWPAVVIEQSDSLTPQQSWSSGESIPHC